MNDDKNFYTFLCLCEKKEINSEERIVVEIKPFFFDLNSKRINFYFQVFGNFFDKKHNIMILLIFSYTFFLSKHAPKTQFGIQFFSSK